MRVVGTLSTILLLLLAVPFILTWLLINLLIIIKEKLCRTNYN